MPICYSWVLSAILIWQYLNAKHEEDSSGRYTKNFLLVAPGIIVYERLLDAYLGKRKEDGKRDFEQSDFKMFEPLFIPPAYKEEIFGFIQSSVAQKEEISRKVTGEGLIALTVAPSTLSIDSTLKLNILICFLQPLSLSRCLFLSNLSIGIILFFYLQDLFLM
jgi:hypothetical protein